MKVCGKEVVYFVEDSGTAADAAYEARTKRRRLDPIYYKSMQFMVCVSTEETRFSVFAGNGRDWPTTLISEQSVQMPNGFPAPSKFLSIFCDMLCHGLLSWTRLRGKEGC